MLTIDVQPTIYADIIEKMRSNYPWAANAGTFYLLGGKIVPYSPKPTILKIETSHLGEPILIQNFADTELSVGVTPSKKQMSVTIVTQSTSATVPLQLRKGINKIQVTAGTEVAYLIVYATTIVGLWEAFARVLYSNSLKIINDQKIAIYSQQGTRLVEPFIKFPELLPDSQSLQILATRLLTRGLIHSVGTTEGVNDIIKALCLTSPVWKNMDKDSMDLYPMLDPWTRSASAFSGQEAHVWIPNVGIMNWMTFIKYVGNQPNVFDVTAIIENEVVLNYQGKQQRHMFDFDAFSTDFISALARTECFNTIQLNISLQSIHHHTICSATYTFDLWIDHDHQIGGQRRSFDISLPFDSNVPYDTDEIDVYSDGWVGLSLTGRFEQDYPIQHCLDTFVNPAKSYAGAACCYDSFYTQLINTQVSEPELDVTITTDGWIETAFPWIIQSPNGVKWRIRIATTGNITAISGETRAPSNYKVTKPDLTEASFAITNDGNLVVVSPPAGGETLMTTLYVTSTGGSVWSVEVANDDNIVTTKIFPV